MKLFLKSLNRDNTSTQGFIPFIVVILVALVAIPVTTVLVKNQQDLRQRAYFTEGGEGGGTEPGCPNNAGGGLTNYCLPLDLSGCPNGYSHYPSSDGDLACSADGTPQMCCTKKAAPTLPPIQSCEQKYGTGYECLDAFSPTCAAPNIIESATGTSCNTGGAYACCKAVVGKPPGPTGSFATKSCNGDTIVITFKTSYVPNATSYNALYGVGSYSNTSLVSSNESTITVSGFSPNIDIYYDLEACNAQGCTLDPNGYFGPINTGTCKTTTPPSCATKYGDSGYQCLANSSNECQFGTIKSTNDTDCIDSAGFNVSCCKAAASTPTPSATPTLQPGSSVTCAQKYGTGYQCLANSSNECQFGTIKSDTTNTDCADSPDVVTSCCKAATPTPTKGQCPPNNSDGSTNTCRQYSKFSLSKCPSGETQLDDGGACSAKYFGLEYACCKGLPYQCGSDKAQPESCFNAFNGCPSGAKLSSHEPGTSCNASGEVCCSSPYQCEAKGGRCINPFSQSCTATETAFSGTFSSCGTTNQMCCVPNTAVQEIYRRDRGYTCSDNIIYNLQAGQTKNSIDVVDCKKQGKVCKELSSSSFTYYTCLDNSNPAADKLDDADHATDHCGTAENKNKIYGIGLVETDEIDTFGNKISKWTYDKFRRDCTAEGKICTTIGNIGMCSTVQLSNEIVPAPASRVTNNSGIKQGENSVNTIINDFSADWYDSATHRCVDNMIKTVISTGDYSQVITVDDCNKKNKTCIEKNQKISCGLPITVDSTAIDHMYCGDTTTNFNFDVNTSNLLLAGFSDLLLSTTGIDMVLLAKDAVFTADQKKAEAYFEGKGLSKAGTLTATQLEEAFIKKGVGAQTARLAALRLLGPAGYVFNPSNVILFVKTGTAILSYKISGNNFDYWTCDGDRIEKRRIDVDKGTAKSEYKNCDKGTACKIFDDTCVVCAKKPLASLSVLGEATSSTCPLKSYGDANCDKKVDNNDLLIFRKEILSNSGITADFDGDGKITTFDLDNFIPSN